MEFLKEFANSKFPELAVIFALFYFGTDLLKNSTDFNTWQGVIGIVLITIGIVFCILFLIDQKYRTANNNTIESQGKAIDRLTKAVVTITQTNTSTSKSISEMSRASSQTDAFTVQVSNPDSTTSSIPSQGNKS